METVVAGLGTLIGLFFMVAMVLIWILAVTTAIMLPVLTIAFIVFMFVMVIRMFVAIMRIESNTRQMKDALTKQKDAEQSVTAPVINFESLVIHDNAKETVPVENCDETGTSDNQ